MKAIKSLVEKAVEIQFWHFFVVVWIVCTLYIGFAHVPLLGTLSESYITYRKPLTEGGVVPREQAKVILDTALFVHPHEFEKLFLNSGIPVQVVLYRNVYVAKLPTTTNYIASTFVDQKLVAGYGGRWIGPSEDIPGSSSISSQASLLTSLRLLNLVWPFTQ